MIVGIKADQRHQEEQRHAGARQGSSFARQALQPAWSSQFIRGMSFGFEKHATSYPQYPLNYNSPEEIVLCASTLEFADETLTMLSRS